MARYSDYGGWPKYVPVAERRRKAEREVEKLRKKGQSITPVHVEGRVIAATFWGKAWCENLEGYRDFESRLPRGRTYVRNGSVVHLRISALEIEALVSGSSMYKVSVKIKELPREDWRSICGDCAGGIDSLVELLRGKLSKGVMARICRQDSGLFPKPTEITFSCSCPDYASMCKHIAAVLYGVGSRLDTEPELLFRLRGVNENDLVAAVSTAVPLSKRAPAKAKVLDSGDVEALFGVELEDTETHLTIEAEARVTNITPGASKKATRKVSPAKSKAAAKVSSKKAISKAKPARALSKRKKRS
jgi:uncharacterized Zn finger protein